MPAFRARSDDTSFFTLGDRDFVNDLFLTGKATTALLQDGVGDVKPLTTALPTIVTSDNVPDSAGPGDPVLTVDAAHTISTVDTIGDQDYYQVTLVAGHDYQIGMYGYTGGPNALPNADSYVEIYGADGTTLIVSGDGGADTPANAVNSGFDVLLTYTPDTTGTYYVNARAFDQDSTNGSTGDGVGDYELFVHDATGDPNIYRPYYDVDSPLYAIDWGTRVNKVDQTAANPDGNEGTRETGNAQGTPVYGSAFDMDALLAANGKTADDIAGKNVITIYFARAGEIITSAEDPTNPGLPPVAVETSDVSDFEHNAVMTALHQFEKVADVVYLEVQDNSQADFEYASYKGTPGPGISLLGSMEPPDEPNEGLALFNSGDYRWNATDLQQGGFSFVTLIHEIGHGHGLAHPHDNGGHSGIMHGVEPEGAGVADYTTGDYDLNQSVFTMMSYEDGWQTSPYGNAPTTGGYGYLGGLMAFDIAAIQDKYGVNEDWATGNDAYVLKDVNAPGTYFTSIWDAGGTDSIVYAGARAANIDLRPATLQYEYGGGGWVSYAYGIFGGYTIANGVTIENAYGGSGNDVLIGNDAANLLNGRGGIDSMTGGAGDDRIYVDNVGDQAFESAGQGNDRVFATASYALRPGQEIETLSTDAYDGSAAINLTGNEIVNFIMGNAAANVLAGGGGADTLVGNAGNDQLIGGTGADYMNGGTGNDLFYIDNAADQAFDKAGEGNDRVLTSVSYTLGVGQEIETLSTDNAAGTAAIDLTGNEFANTIMGNAGANMLSGGGGNDTLVGNAGGDTLTGGAGADVMNGGLGDDFFYVDNGADQAFEKTGEGNDRVLTSVSYTLGVGQEIETLSTDNDAGTAAINLTGNAFANILIGNEGANLLDGKGGNDVLTGNGGTDTFAFTTALGAGNVDQVNGFVSGTDQISLGHNAFTAIGLGTLNPNAFFIGSAAHDADDRIIYDSATGALYYDADGNGAGAAVQFATLASHPALTASDFHVI